MSNIKAAKLFLQPSAEACLVIQSSTHRSIDHDLELIMDFNIQRTQEHIAVGSFSQNRRIKVVMNLVAIFLQCTDSFRFYADTDS